MAKSFDELANRYMTPHMRAKAATRGRELLAGMLLSEIRKLTGKSQGRLAKALGVKQPSVSKMEQQDDMQISTLFRLIEAMGGHLRLIAEFPKGDVRIVQFKANGRKTSKKQARHVRQLQLI